MDEIPTDRYVDLYLYCRAVPPRVTGDALHDEKHVRNRLFHADGLPGSQNRDCPRSGRSSGGAEDVSAMRRVIVVGQMPGSRVPFIAADVLC